MFNKYKNGAWEEPENTVKRYASGAWEECEFANRHKNGAWEAVWEAIQYMTELNNTLPSGAIVGAVTGSDGKGWGIWYFDGNTGSGAVTYYLDGEFTNPSISFDYDGFFCYTPSGSMTYATVGKVDIYTRNTSGTENYTSAVSSINVRDGYESYSGTLNGTYNRVGFRFTFNNWSVGADMNPQYLFNIYNILINGKDCLPAKE